MQLDTLIENTYQTLRLHTANAKLILLHPRSRYRSLLISKLINSPDAHVFYYALGPDDTDLKSFIAGMTHDLANQHATFGRHVNILSPNAQGNFHSVLDAFARDISELSDEPFFLILDEYDRSDTADDIQMLVEKLAGRLPDHCRMIINSRTLPRLPWVSLIAQKCAVLLEDEVLIKRNFYEITTEGKIRLDVFALGPGQVNLNGKAIDEWEGHLPRLLFFFALDKAIITRSEICEAFWPELDIDQAVNVFHVTKRRLHKAMELDVLVHDGGYYRINPNMAVHYDVTDFASALVDGRVEDQATRIAAWQRAIDMYRGPFLQGHTDKWIVDRRADFRAGYLEALTEMARVRLAEDRPENALALFQRALIEDFSRQEIHREVMQLFARLGRRSEAAAHYQRVVDDLRKDGKTPDPETQKLYNSIVS